MEERRPSAAAAAASSLSSTTMQRRRRRTTNNGSAGCALVDDRRRCLGFWGAVVLSLMVLVAGCAGLLPGAHGQPAVAMLEGFGTPAILSCVNGTAAFAVNLTSMLQPGVGSTPSFSFVAVVGEFSAINLYASSQVPPTSESSQWGPGDSSNNVWSLNVPSVAYNSSSPSLVVYGAAVVRLGRNNLNFSVVAVPIQMISGVAADYTVPIPPWGAQVWQFNVARGSHPAFRGEICSSNSDLDIPPVQMSVMWPGATSSLTVQPTSYTKATNWFEFLSVVNGTIDFGASNYPQPIIWYNTPTGSTTAYVVVANAFDPNTDADDAFPATFHFTFWNLLALPDLPLIDQSLLLVRVQNSLVLNMNLMGGPARCENVTYTPIYIGPDQPVPSTVETFWGAQTCFLTSNTQFYFNGTARALETPQESDQSSLRSLYIRDLYREMPSYRAFVGLLANSSNCGVFTYPLVTIPSAGWDSWWTTICLIVMSCLFLVSILFNIRFLRKARRRERGYSTINSVVSD